MGLDAMLAELKRLCSTSPIDEAAALRQVETILLYLLEPANNTDENCTKVDMFVLLDMEELVQPPEEYDASFPFRLHHVLNLVMGLHDTHSHPEIACNMRSTPQDLLAETQDALAKLG